MAIKLIHVEDPSLAGSMYMINRRAFTNDGLQIVLFPPRLIDPADPDEEHRFRLEVLRKRLVAPGAWSIVAIDNDVKDEDGVVKVMGYASWYAPEASAVGDGLSGQDEKDEGWVDDGEGGFRGDGVKYPRCLDIKVLQEVERSSEESKRLILGDPAKPGWCMFILFHVRAHGARKQADLSRLEVSGCGSRFLRSRNCNTARAVGNRPSGERWDSCILRVKSSCTQLIQTTRLCCSERPSCFRERSRFDRHG
jgi:hypothetical protein